MQPGLLSLSQRVAGCNCSWLIRARVSRAVLVKFWEVGVNVPLLFAHIFREGSMGSLIFVLDVSYGIGLTQCWSTCVFPCVAGVMSRHLSTLCSVSHDARDGSQFERIPSYFPFRTKGEGLVVIRPKEFVIGKKYNLL